MIDRTDVVRGEWFKSSFSNGSQTCVEVKFDTTDVLVRDTKNRPPMLAVPSLAWTSFVRILAD
jgi:hypothetical protein